MTWLVPVSSQGQVTIPFPIRRKFELNGRSSLIIEERKEEVVVKPVKSLVAELAGSLAYLNKGKRPLDFRAMRRKMIKAVAKHAAQEGLR